MNTHAALSAEIPHIEIVRRVERIRDACGILPLASKQFKAACDEYTARLRSLTRAGAANLVDGLLQMAKGESAGGALVLDMPRLSDAFGSCLLIIAPDGTMRQKLEYVPGAGVSIDRAGVLSWMTGEIAFHPVRLCVQDLPA